MKHASFRPRIYNPPDGHVAASRGVCRDCQRIIERGQRFVWLPGVPPAPAHVNCKAATQGCKVNG